MDKSEDKNKHDMLGIAQTMNFATMYIPTANISEPGITIKYSPSYPENSYCVQHH